ncbi:hypothetical protein LTSEUGA_2787 [Salmonella enterica subsp. enterica serovar Uganda str. R8-3404]|uniref:Uncharacterized protein n=1 Tax=Salmonella enterica subsp. enterica serovar Uganda str. R8-3404 TaxID=913083 RepID=A0A6C8H1S9_SALET|nr:hypothetical protein LTSEUGA_2787 [Salmonella enterica subsp. enterica serovar Uganda str. R8-3404]
MGVLVWALMFLRLYLKHKYPDPVIYLKHKYPDPVGSGHYASPSSLAARSR